MFVHIGLPKCASTSLQKAFASIPDAVFLGCNPKNAPGEFYESEVGSFLEKELRLGSDLSFNDRCLDVQQFLSRVDKENKGRVLLSYENLSLKLTPWDLPTDIKYQRLKRVLPNDAQIIFVIREIRGVLLSLYKNYLQMGYTRDFQDFLSEVDALGDLSILNDLDFRAQYDLLLQNFNASHVHVLTLADLQVRMQDLLLLHQIVMPPLEIENAGMRDEHISAALEYNVSRCAQKSFTDWLELHRIMHAHEMSEEDVFYLSRFRHAQEAAVKNAQGAQFSFENVNWPEHVLSLETRNRAFLKELIE